MQLGELFFTLGFQSEGTGEAEVFNDTITMTAQTTNSLQESLDNLATSISLMGKRLGGATDNLNKKNKDSAGLFSMLNQKMKDYFGRMNAARLQIIGVGAGLTYFVNKAAEAAIHLDKISSATGLSTDKLQRLGDMAAQSGANVDDLAGAVSSLQKNSIDIMLGRGGNIGPFQFLGLNPHDDPLKILDQLSLKLKKMPTALGTAMAKDLGLSDDLIYFLRNKENLKPTSEETILTDKEIKRLKVFNFEFNRIWEQSKRTLQKISAALTPIANIVLYAFDRISQMFSDLTNKITPYMDTIQKFMPVLATMAAILFAAFFPITATILALGLAFEDLWSFVRGDDSMLGRMLKWFTDIETALEDIITLWYALRSAMTLGDYSDYYAQQASDTINKIKKFRADHSSVNDLMPAGSGVMMNTSGSSANTVNSNITFNIDGTQNPTFIVDEMKKYISSEHRKLEKGQFLEK
jgi:hypothetical protein